MSGAWRMGERRGRFGDRERAQPDLDELGSFAAPPVIEAII